MLYRGGFYRGGALHMSALAGIDQALWDIKGKALGEPVHRCSAGQCARASGSIPGSAATGRRDGEGAKDASRAASPPSR